LREPEVGVGPFYAFNAYIQMRERGFNEPFDMPIALFSLAVGTFALWAALGARRVRDVE
jgi:hypothetical protein